MTHVSWFRLGVALALATAGCREGDLTEIMAVCDSDLTIPQQLDSIELEVQRPPDADVGPFLNRVDPLSKFAVPLPVSWGLRSRENEEREIDVICRAIRRTQVVTETHAKVKFVPAEVRVLCLRVDSACLNVACGAEQTCSRGQCVAARVPGDRLDEYVDDRSLACSGGSSL